MVQSPSWEANWFAASQEIPRISRNPKVHYRNYKRPPTVPILGPPNPVHIPTSHILEIHPNIIHPSTPRPPQWSLSLGFPHQDLINPPLLTHTRHMPSPSHSSRFYHPHNIGWGVQIIKSSLCNLLHSPVTSSLLGPNILLNTMFSDTLSFLSSRNVSDQVSHPYKTTGKIIVLLRPTLLFRNHPDTLVLLIIIWGCVRAVLESQMLRSRIHIPRRYGLSPYIFVL